MKLSKIYTNKPNVFTPIIFNDGLNVIFAEVKHPKDSEKDSHNLGKTTLIAVIDFLLLKKFSSTLFSRHHERFSDFEFYLELQTNQGDYLTVRRDIDSPTKISFKKHSTPNSDFRGLTEGEWDHHRMTFDRAKNALDAYLELSAIKPYSYRQGVSFFLRTQSDFSDVFQLSKNLRSKHIFWKPYLSRVLGFDDEIVQRKYEIHDKLEDLERKIKHLRSGLSSDTLSLDKVKAQIEIKSEEVSQLQKQLDSFRFQVQEAKINEKLIKETEEQITELNQELYDVKYRINKIETSLRIKHEFDLTEVESIFKEAEIYFSEQLKREYGDLVMFNEKLTQDRHKSLKETLRELKEEKTRLENELGSLDKDRSDALAVLTEEDTFQKYKLLQNELVSERAILANLENQQKRLEEIVAIENDASNLRKERDELGTMLKAAADGGNEIFSKIRKTFSSIVKEVLNVTALLHVKANEENNFEFYAEIVRDPETLETTSESEGTTYKKLLCIAFDIAVLEHYQGQQFFNFVYHDGALEGLDSRKKVKLLNRVRETSEKGIQYILSVIDTDLPRDENDKKITFATNEIVCRLSDSGERGRLFKMDTF